MTRATKTLIAGVENENLTCWSFNHVESIAQHFTCNYQRGAGPAGISPLQLESHPPSLPQGLVNEYNSSGHILYLSRATMGPNTA
jgi:hypothetical protein